jgi:hypothetical protein
MCVYIYIYTEIYLTFIYVDAYQGGTLVTILIWSEIYTGNPISERNVKESG